MEKLHILKGMHDLPERSWQPLMAAQDKLKSFFSLHHYKILDTPILEPTELFLRKSGGEIAARMYTFFDPGGNEVSLRPEFTSSVLRHCIEAETPSALPIRVQYAGPVFRYEGDGTSYRQYTQAGAELIGSDNPRADAEILSLSYASLSNLGLIAHTIELSDVGILHQLMNSIGLSERSILFILGSISELKAGENGMNMVRDQARALRLIGIEGDDGNLADKIRGMEDEEARELLHGLVQWAEVGSLGQREPLGVVERLLTKFKGADDPRKLEKAIRLVSRLAEIRGPPDSSLQAAKDLIESNELDTGVLDHLREALALVDNSLVSTENLVVDFGLSKDIAYYTGLIFEIKHPSLPFSIAGGGRCDSLCKALGSEVDIPALGFAYTVELILDILRSQDSCQEIENAAPSGVLVLPAAVAYQQALQIAEELRSKGCPVEMDVRGLTLEDAKAYAQNAGIKEILEVTEEGSTVSHQVTPASLAPAGGGRGS